MELIIRRLTQAVPMPRYAHDSDAGLDICSAEPGHLAPMERRLFRTGIAIQLPPLVEGQIRSRSGLALKHGVIVLNAPGTIDAGYRGEIGVILANLSTKEFVVKSGMRIAQLVLANHLRPIVVEAAVLDETDRGIEGFGSSGI